VRHIIADQQFSYAVGATERLVLFPTWLLLDLLGVVMLSTFGYEHFVLQVIVCAHTYCAVVNLNQIFFPKHTVIAHTAGINLNHIFLFVITHNLKKKIQQATYSSTKNLAWG